jgi:hypothetical protein
MRFELLFIVSFTLLLSACSKEEFFDQKDITFKTAPIIMAPPVSKKVRASLYVNKFDTIIGDTAKENVLLNWAKKEGFNGLYLYGVSGMITNSTSRALLNTFVGKAQAAPFYFTISFVAASDATANNYYNLYYTNVAYPNKFNAINTEYEYWNTSAPNNTSFDIYLTLLNSITNMNALTTSPKIQRNLYVYQFSDANYVNNVSPNYYPNTSILTYLINNNDKILIANYHTNAGTIISPLLVTKLNELSAQANALGKIANVEILYNVNNTSASPNIYAYCATNPFITAYNNFITNYNASVSITNKANLRIVGYSYYRYTEAKLARP